MAAVPGSIAFGLAAVDGRSDCGGRGDGGGVGGGDRGGGGDGGGGDGGGARGGGGRWRRGTSKGVLGLHELPQQGGADEEA